jgi:endonuclease-3
VRRTGGQAGRRAGGRNSGQQSEQAAPTKKPIARETAHLRRMRTEKILDRLKQAYPEARCALEHADAWQLLVATILSAQCTDVRVNMVTPALFGAYPGPAAMAKARQADVEAIIKSTGFFRNKAKNLIAMAQALVAGHGGKVPRTMAELHALPGVGRKTANVVLGNAYGINEGITVDTHVGRIARLLRLTRHEDPVRIEQDLMLLVPREDWTLVSHLLISHGRAVCIARRPRCGECPIARYCPSVQP